MSERSDGIGIEAGRRNFVADMGIESLMVDRERSVIRVALTPENTSVAGTAPVGLVATLADIAASDPALANIRPDWTATQDLEVHAMGWTSDGPLVVDCRLVRLGKKIVIVTVDVYDSHGVDAFGDLVGAIDGGSDDLSRTGRGLVTFARLPGTAAGDDRARYDPSDYVGIVRERVSGHRLDQPLHQEMGMRVIDASSAVVELDRTPYVANSIGTINGGAQAMLVEAASEAVCPGMVATDLQIHYLSQVRAGPARARAELDRRSRDHAVATVALVDAGHHDQLLALATVTLQTPPG